MSLYERNKTGTHENVGNASRTETGIVSFIKETYKLFGASMLAGAVGAYVGVPIASQIQPIIFLLFIVEIGLLIGLHFVKNKPGINLIVLFAFTFMTGITLAPLLSMAIGITGGGMIVGNAFAMTAVIFAGMSLFAIKSTKDFTGYGKPLMIALIVVIIGSLLNMFVFNSPIIHILIQGVVVLLFSVMIIFDTQNIIKGNYEHPIEGAVALYLDFLNMFTALLQILLAFTGKDD